MEGVGLTGGGGGLAVVSIKWALIILGYMHNVHLGSFASLTGVIWTKNGFPADC